ncbi:MAG: 2-succinyl-5-enolpyruvyl-6-hydroxy-3-cyclohexene-1-carboxylic-acid synthase, partial [Puniceicoccales bacterium]
FQNQESEPAESAKQALCFVRRLIVLGVQDFIVSPGSRSTPLVLALQHFPQVRVRVILDERSAGFFALGRADESHRPVALVCTSGTAGANYFPAVIEASERGVPLLLLTADRPPELRDCGAGQTIDQVGLYGKFVRWSVDALAPESASGDSFWETIAGEGLRRAVSKNPGPVHFNLPFREPFLPGVAFVEPVEEDLPAPVGSVGQAVEVDWWDLRRAGPGLIVVGAANPENSRQWCDGLFRLSDFLGWPILADVLNPLRQAPGAAERVVTQYEGLVAAGALTESSSLAPRALLQVGIQPTAKNLRQALAGFDGPRWQWSRLPKGLDPARKPFQWIGGSPADLGELPEGDFAEDAYRGSWLEMEARAVRVIAKWMDGVPENFEGRIHYEISRGVPRESAVFVANSMPVRDAERFWFANRPQGPRVFSSRGASGIEGLVSLVAGIAGGGVPTYAVLGDLSFLHDSGGLKVAATLKGSLTLVVIDNGGGRIFGQLPICSERAVFEEFFLTPQSVDLVRLCEAHGIPVQVLERGEGLKEALRESRPGARVILVQTDPAADDLRRAEWRVQFQSLL